MTDIMADGPFHDNGDLIAHVASLGYIEGRVLDLTYGRGKFWTDFTPERLCTNDIDETTDAFLNHDFRATGFETGAYDTVVFDPPYRLRGTPSLGEMDDRYGTTDPATRRDVIALLVGGAAEACRLSNKWVLVKCQDQVEGGQVRWQTDVVTAVAWAASFDKVDWFILNGGRRQPAGRSQQHARREFSTLLVFRRKPR